VKESIVASGSNSVYSYCDYTLITWKSRLQTLLPSGRVNIGLQESLDVATACTVPVVVLTFIVIQGQ